MLRSIHLLVLTAALAVSQDPARPAPVPAPSPRVGFALIVNAKNPTSEGVDTARATIRTLFLKELTEWPDGTEARPYGREDGSEVQQAFAARVLDMTDAALARHWLRVKNTNGTTPPKQVDSDRMVLKFVARHAGAFGIVSSRAAAGAEGIRILFEF